MPRAYIRLDPRFAERKSSYPDGPYRAFIDTLCAAEYQPQRGRFRNERTLRAMLDRAARHVGYLIEHGDLEVLDDGRVYVVGWDEWQEGDVTVRERQQRIRNRRCHGVRNGRRNGPDSDFTAIDIEDSISDSGGGSNSVRPLRRPERPPLSDDEQREHLDRLADVMSANGIPMPKLEKPLASTTDEELVERYTKIVLDEDEPDWRREAARAQLGLMGVQP